MDFYAQVAVPAACDNPEGTAIAGLDTAPPVALV